MKSESIIVKRIAASFIVLFFCFKFQLRLLVYFARCESILDRLNQSS